MNEPKDHGSSNSCPINHAAMTSSIVMQECHNLLGEPQLNGENSIAGIEGRVVVDFLTSFLHRINEIDIINPTQMVSFNNESIPGYTEMQDALRQRTGGGEIQTQMVSKLAKVIFIKLRKEHALDLDVMSSLDFAHLSQAFIQAFDSIFITGARQAKNISEWKSMKGSMWKIIINLARVPTNVQESLLGNSCVSGKQNKKITEPYLLEHMKGIWESMKLYPEHGLGRTLAILESRGGYGECPAIKDRVLKQSFNIMFEIYGKVLINENKEDVE